MKPWASRVCVVVVLVVLLTSSLPVSAQEYRNLSSVHDGSGLMSTNTVSIGGRDYRHVSAAGQPGGIATSSNSPLVNYAGFLQAVDIKHPNQDTDGDGVIDEISQDNDSDSLTDLEEVQGSQFDPVTPTEVNLADTDGDGISDGREAVAETDPTDEDANLRILTINHVVGGKEITYLAKASKDYEIRASKDSFREPDDSLGTDTEVDGVGAWNVRTNTFTDLSGSTNAKFYAVEPLVD